MSIMILNLGEGRRVNEDGSSRDSSDDFSDLNPNPERLSQNLLSEIKKAVNEAQPKGKIKSVFC
jgi:neurabin